MRVSEHFNLGLDQPSLDFVDVDIRGDLRVFIDPRALKLLPTEWGDECTALIQHFFGAVLEAIKTGQHDHARLLLGTLREPNETHLGLSIRKARGRALGPESATDLWRALRSSQAVETGLLQDLEDTILAVEGIGADIVSDITTNVIREPLINYTQAVCEYYGIPTQASVDSGPLWSPQDGRWASRFVTLPIARNAKLLLVPKAIVRQRMDYDVDEYYRHYILEHLRTLELDANSELVQLLKNGKTRVTKKALQEKYGTGKAVVVRETLQNPQLLEEYRRDKDAGVSSPLSHAALAREESTPLPDWVSLLRAVRDLPPGQEAADEYERRIEALLTALLYPSLTFPKRQRKMHDGRKRIDITYTNSAMTGFFHWVGMHYTAPHIFVECKNYGHEVGNPELDQLSGRFSPSRGRVGMLICRSFRNKDLFLQRCKDTASDDRGYIIALDDSDLAKLVEEIQDTGGAQTFGLLRERFDALVM